MSYKITGFDRFMLWAIGLGMLASLPLALCMIYILAEQLLLTLL